MWVSTSGPLANFQGLWEALNEVQRTEDPATRAFLIAKLKRELIELRVLSHHIEAVLASAESPVFRN